MNPHLLLLLTVIACLITIAVTVKFLSYVQKKIEIKKKRPVNFQGDNANHYQEYTKECPACGQTYSEPKFQNEPTPHIAHYCKGASVDSKLGCGYKWTCEVKNPELFGVRSSSLENANSIISSLKEENLSLKEELSLFKKPTLKESDNYREPAEISNEGQSLPSCRK